MASHGATKELAASQPTAKPAKGGKKELEGITIKKSANGGLSIEHRFTRFEHPPEIHVFAADQGENLRAHLEKHLGISLPGKSKTDTMESKEQDT
jgi:hypothetical protein